MPLNLSIKLLTPLIAALRGGFMPSAQKPEKALTIAVLALVKPLAILPPILVAQVPMSLPRLVTHVLILLPVSEAQSVTFFLVLVYH
jgi:hypothetical protein